MELLNGPGGPEGGWREGRGGGGVRRYSIPYYYVFSDLWSPLLHISSAGPVTFCSFFFNYYVQVPSIQNMA